MKGINIATAFLMLLSGAVIGGAVSGQWLRDEVEDGVVAVAPAGPEQMPDEGPVNPSQVTAETVAEIEGRTHRWSRDSFDLSSTPIVATTSVFELCDPGVGDVTDLTGERRPYEGPPTLLVGDVRIAWPQDYDPGFLPRAQRLADYAFDYWVIRPDYWEPGLVRILASEPAEINGQEALLQVYRTGTMSTDGIYSVNEYDIDMGLRVVLFDEEAGALLLSTRRTDEAGLEQLARVVSCVLWSDGELPQGAV